MLHQNDAFTKNVNNNVDVYRTKKRRQFEINTYISNAFAHTHTIRTFIHTEKIIYISPIHTIHIHTSTQKKYSCIRKMHLNI